MPNISQKGVYMPESQFVSWFPMQKQPKKRGKNVFYLNIGQPDIQTPNVALEAIQNFKEKGGGIQPLCWTQSYRKGLVGYYKKQGIEVTHEDIMVTTGGSSPTVGLNSCLDSGDEIIIPEPFYANYNGFSISAGVSVKPPPPTSIMVLLYRLLKNLKSSLHQKQKPYLSVIQAIQPATYILRKELETLKNIVIKHDLFLFADEVYREFCYDGHQHHSVLNMQGLEQHAVVMRLNL